jgi:hypothetical protein
MCAACGPGQVHGELISPVVDPGRPAPPRFAALRNRDCRVYLVGSLLSMCADNVEQQFWECM